MPDGRPAGQQDFQDWVDLWESEVRKNDAETWFAYPASVARLLKLVSGRERIYFLAGDVHYSYLFDVNGFKVPEHKISARTRLVQGVSSPLRYPLKQNRIDGVIQYGERVFKDKVDNDHYEDGLKFGTGEHVLREPFGIPEQIFGRKQDERYNHRYTTDNLIATLEVAVDQRAQLRWWAWDDGKKALAAIAKYDVPA
jgi:hypothetical protein